MRRPSVSRGSIKANHQLNEYVKNGRRSSPLSVRVGRGEEDDFFNDTGSIFSLFSERANSPHSPKNRFGRKRKTSLLSDYGDRPDSPSSSISNVPIPLHEQLAVYQKELKKLLETIDHKDKEIKRLQADIKRKHLNVLHAQSQTRQKCDQYETRIIKLERDCDKKLLEKEKFLRAKFLRDTHSLTLKVVQQKMAEESTRRQVDRMQVDIKEIVENEILSLPTKIEREQREKDATDQKSWAREKKQLLLRHITDEEVRDDLNAVFKKFADKIDSEAYLFWRQEHAKSIQQNLEAALFNDRRNLIEQKRALQRKEQSQTAHRRHLGKLVIGNWMKNWRHKQATSKALIRLLELGAVLQKMLSDINTRHPGISKAFQDPESFFEQLNNKEMQRKLRELRADTSIDRKSVV